MPRRGRAPGLRPEVLAASVVPLMIRKIMQHHHSRHAHGHQPGASKPENFGAAFAIGAALNLALVAAEIGFGFLSNSVALISDGVHNSSDVLALFLAWAGSWLTAREPSAMRTYGFRRASILAALANAALLFVVTGAILIEALQRLAEAPPVATAVVLWVAGVAAVVNAATALLFARGRKHDLNIAGTFLHMASDAAMSLGVVIAALLIAWTGWLWLDPAASILIAAAILASSWHLMRNALSRLMPFRQASIAWTLNLILQASLASPKCMISIFGQ